MKNSAIKLLAIDLDGTALNSQRQLTEKTLKSLQDAVQAGILVVPCTGRVLSTIPEEIMNLPGISYIISSSGASIRNRETGEILYSHPIDTETALAILKAVNEEDLGTEFYIDGKACISRDKARFYRDIFPPDFLSNYLGLFRHLSSEDLQKAVETLPVEKIDCKTTDPAIISRILEKLKVLGELNIYNDDGVHLEITAGGVNKGSALKKLADTLFLSPENVMSVGDSDNDLEMIEYAGTGVVMGEAPAHLKEIADSVTGTNDQDGLAEAVEELLD